MSCKEFEQSLLLYLYDELTEGQRSAWDAHLASCAHCRARLDEERGLHELLSRRPLPEPTPRLLAECRQSLGEALDREPVRLGWKELLLDWFSVPPSRAFRASGAVGVLAFGFSLGWALRPKVAAIRTASREIAPASIAGADLNDMRISGISSVAPDPKTGEVHITLDAARRVTLEGSLDDPRIQQLLVSAVKSYENPGIRRDTLDALRARGDNPNVRQALLYAMAHDSNLGVRLEALDAVQELEWGPDSRLAFLSILQRDTNPELRNAALDQLTQHMDPDMLPLLKQLASNDSCRYVRLKCARVIRQVAGK